MQKVDNSLYLIFLPILLILGGAVGLVLNSQDHPSTIPGYALNAGCILAIFIGPYVFFRMRRQDLWPNRAQDICQRYQGSLNIIENILGKNSYVVDFLYKNCKVQFLDTVKAQMYKDGVGYARRTVVIQDKLLFRSPVSSRLNILMKISAGESLIGETVDFLSGDGRKDISRNPSLSMYKGFTIFSNQEDEAVRFLIDFEVKSVFLKYKEQCTAYSGYPFEIDNGFVNFKFVGTDSLRLKKEDDLNPYLDDLISLTKKL